MFDEDKYKDSDDLMRSILSQEQEEVPAHVWEGISSKLDGIEPQSAPMLFGNRLLGTARTYSSS